MKLILLTKGYSAQVDDEDYESLSKYKWQCHAGGYAVRAEGPKKKRIFILMHRDVLKIKHGDKVHIDHIDGNRLNNTKQNLRCVTNQQNCFNKKGSFSTSQYKGVCWSKTVGKWKSAITFNYKTFHLGLFIDEVEAAKAYDTAALKYYGQYSKLNFPLQNSEECGA